MAISKQRAILLGLVVSVVITVTKFIAYFLTGANSALTDALENIVNIIAGAFAFYSIYVSLKPRDTNHPYGHGKVEFFSAFVEGILICTVSVVVIVKVSLTFFNNEPLEKPGAGLILIAISGLMNLLTGLFLIRLGNKQNSPALVADGKHLLSDTYTSAGVVISFVIVMVTHWHYADNIISIIMALLILYTGYGIVRRSVAGLMDEADTERVKEVLTALIKDRRAEWIDVHNLRAQQYGADLHVDCHVTLPYYFDLNQVHGEVEAIEKSAARGSKGNAELSIHADPCLPECCHYCSMPQCPVRKHPKTTEVEWNMTNITANQKHFISA